MVTGVKVEYRLEGASNFNYCNSRVLISLEENALLEFMESGVPEPEDNAHKSQWKKNGIKARKIMIESVKDRLVPQIFKL